MIAVALVALLVVVWLASVGKARAVNAEIEQELGEAYNPDAAGNPRRDAGCIVLLAAVVFIVAAMALSVLAQT